MPLVLLTSERPIVGLAQLPNQMTRCLVGGPEDVTVVVGPEKIWGMTGRTKSITGHSLSNVERPYAMRYDAVTSDASPCESVEVALWNPASTRQ